MWKSKKLQKRASFGDGGYLRQFRIKQCFWGVYGELKACFPPLAPLDRASMTEQTRSRQKLWDEKWSFFTWDEKWFLTSSI